MIKHICTSGCFLIFHRGHQYLLETVVALAEQHQSVYIALNTEEYVLNKYPLLSGELQHYAHMAKPSYRIKFISHKLVEISNQLNRRLFLHINTFNQQGSDIFTRHTISPAEHPDVNNTFNEQWAEDTTPLDIHLIETDDFFALAKEACPSITSENSLWIVGGDYANKTYKEQECVKYSIVIPRIEDVMDYVSSSSILLSLK
jgi:hypothetical protein